ncbi:hypothetical protein K8Q94_00330 [Candidatus Nomurabacteria bacterium]|nr:hypothetical protein [Candidatus Nomurabacteria bacterium]
MEENKTSGSNPEQKNWISRHPMITTIIVLGMSLMIGGLSNQGNSIQSDETNNTSISTTPNIQPDINLPEKTITSKVKNESVSTQQSITETNNTIYAKKFYNVILLIESGNSDAQSGISAFSTSTPDALFDLRQAQAEFSKAQLEMQSLQVNVPEKFIDINRLMNEAINNYTSGMNILIPALEDENNPDSLNQAKSAYTYFNKAVMLFSQAELAIKQLNAKEGIY